jgi:S1-C subfamily serine protease
VASATNDAIFFGVEEHDMIPSVDSWATVGGPRVSWCGAIVQAGAAMLFGLWAWGPVAAQEDLSDVITRSERSVVRIDVKTATGSGIGSGFIVGADGLLVTNVHVLSGATSALAVFEDGRKFPIKGTYVVDPSRDICVARIEASQLPTISLAAVLPRKGEQVVALGCPQGLSFSATRGIVSALRQRDEFRQMVGRAKAEGTWIQVDAAISGGNSGGPLINSRGEVVAMSTLGSTGEAQNLNFGISNEDIAAAIAKAKTAPLVDLQSGVGQVEVAEMQPEGSGGIIDRGEIPATALADYIARGRQEYKELVKDLKRESTDARKKLEAMRKGETRIPLNTQANVVIRVTRYGETYMFRDESVKRAKISEQQSYVSELDRVRGQLKSDSDNPSMLALLLHGGPWLDPRNVNKIGFMRNAVVLAAFNDHDVVVLYNDAPYLLWVKSAAGLSAGEVIPPTPVFVAGTKTMLVPGTGTQAVTILNTVTEAELRTAIFGVSDLGSADYRTWTDPTGKFSIEAKLSEISGTEVVLESRDGKQVRVPIEKLSDPDRRLLGR